MIGRACRAVWAMNALVSLAACMPPSWGAKALLHPSRRALTAPIPSEARPVELSGEGVVLRGWRFRAARPSRGTMVYLHGSADNRASGIHIARRFVKRGFDALLYDSRAHGRSGGTACTYGYWEKRDLARVLDLLEPQPILLIGVSLGAGVALQAAADDPRISAIVAVATFSDLRTVATERAPFFATTASIDKALSLAETEAAFRVAEVSPVIAATRIRAPVLLIHGESDEQTPPAHSKRVFAALRSQKRLRVVPGAGHDDVLRREVWHEIEAWVDEVLPAPSVDSADPR